MGVLFVEPKVSNGDDTINVAATARIHMYIILGLKSLPRLWIFGLTQGPEHAA
jgi:hypothetical protein